ncbi:hypothetical protein PHYSODRAFT_341817 [Phytophthora sojae]|uniref:Uncharacterized protein n=1 Tax=Phytophthora sojae (strain P6497) TaxID=1094619 RepID=G5AEG5_PHYSP|nr:hypothetical protein PHYSODRAFT_341817 [Phytophthora sojae]EGZ06567.1 hypothetical protein PHYSODRAFT_341817 [Phytophthora sojae]|eukprot:XP_009538464.1 hypothetical protein PHYSODRAFT_341817 [Phytophthora sojae]
MQDSLKSRGEDPHPRRTEDDDAESEESETEEVGVADTSPEEGDAATPVASTSQITKRPIDTRTATIKMGRHLQQPNLTAEKKLATRFYLAGKDLNERLPLDA